MQIYMINLSEVKKNNQILEFIKQTEASLVALSYTDHGFRRLGIFADIFSFFYFIKNSGRNENSQSQKKQSENYCQRNDNNVFFMPAALQDIFSVVYVVHFLIKKYYFYNCRLYAFWSSENSSSQINSFNFFLALGEGSSLGTPKGNNTTTLY